MMWTERPKEKIKYKRLSDILRKERTIAFNNLIYAHDISMGIECLRELSDEHSNICIEFQKAMNYRISYAKLKTKSLQENYLK